jgi:hypothetical protein
MRVRRIYFLGGFLLALIVVACFVYWRMTHSPFYQGKKLALQHCSSCHVFPEPSLADKATWEKSVLHQMAFRMGLERTRVQYSLSPDEMNVIRKILPEQPMVSEAEFELIRQYYIDDAPVELVSIQKDIATVAKQFQAKVAPAFGKKLITLIQYDTLTKKLYVGNALSWLYELDQKLSIVDSFKLESPLTWMSRSNGHLYVSTIGKLFPTDLPLGELSEISSPDHRIIPILDSLQRPVYFHQEDLNNDQRDDILVCSFGNYTGNLSAYFNLSDGAFQKKTISLSPGCRKVAVLDWNNDGKKDILALMTQGDERFAVFLSQGGSAFKEEVLLRFPPIYGFSNFEIVDFNQDGYPDVIATNGDNADYTNITKPYHAVRIMENKKNNTLEEVWSFPMPGAWSTRCADFDGDGDLDIAAISYFPDNKLHPEQNFIYFENTGNYTFVPQLIPMTQRGQWMVMEAGDIDRDGDIDVLLGSCAIDNMQAINNKVPEHEQLDLLLLENARKGNP